MSEYGDREEKNLMQQAKNKAKDEGKKNLRKVLVSMIKAIILAVGKYVLIAILITTIVSSIVDFLTGGGGGGTNAYADGDFSDISYLEGNTVQEKVWIALRSLGYSEIATAGAMGNIHYESGTFDPSTVQGGMTEVSGGIGLCQWTGTRNRALKAYAASKGVHWSDENTQIEFLITELTGTGDAVGYASKDSGFMDRRAKGYDDGHLATEEKWKNASTVEDATKAFCYSFEGCSVTDARNSMSARIKHANNYYDQFQGKTFGSASTGMAVQYYQGYPEEWANEPYGHGTLANSGCGITCMAMVAATYTGENITPPDLLYEGENTAYGEGGFQWDGFTKIIEHFNYPFKVESLDLDSKAVIENLKKGYMVISSQKSPSQGSLFTRGARPFYCTSVH